KKSLTVKDWDEADKPREKLLTLGKKALTNAELIAILLRTGVKGSSVVEMAKEVLASAGNRLTTLSRLEASQLTAINGMAKAKAATLIAALELGWRMQGEFSEDNILILNDSKALFNYMSPLVADIDHEEFWAIYLNNAKKVIGRQRIASGGQTSTAVDIRMVFRGALECKAVALMVVHNHPSGSLRPSPEDKHLTQQLSEAGNLLQIKLYEHLIIGLSPTGQVSYYSFHDEGHL
ncbi:MAG: DNA repair protein RadC, partial [Bacteroidales bacterium]|nr:DNA repair protein RadC [Bacteroidales bacterium]